MSSNTRNLILVALAVLVVGVAGYYVYQQQNRPALEISVGNQTLRVETGP